MPAPVSRPLKVLVSEVHDQFDHWHQSFPGSLALNQFRYLWLLEC